MANRERRRAPRLLLADDDAEPSSALSRVLRCEGYDVEQARDGQAGLHLALTRTYDVMVISRTLPVVDGVSLIRRLRGRAVTTRALLIAPDRTVPELIEALDSGADDYLARPFETGELTARLRALCRRPVELAQVLRIGEGQLDLRSRTAVLPEGGRIPLSDREFRLIRILADHPAAVHPREELARRVFRDASSASLVATYVYYLRRKLGRTAVRTVHNLGYQLGEL
ncbi:response regulator transcription factor [Kineosporia sp. J2-2]|uniref:Response regulator transcription factor n=1 Tax=Kineosporia corallincola TaxID=2835133 RepID=A0ABS5TSW0_9ACTN|nr:response regulator transcription factor [Kineosporia corallincola]MBT0773867.1 response regulator transcription factor [Kineosporia corallincola]